MTIHPFHSPFPMSAPLIILVGADSMFMNLTTFL